MKSRFDSILLVGFGGPTRPEEIRPFLANVTRGRNIPAERIEEVAHHYERIGGRSPYNELIMRQASALKAVMRSEGSELGVYVGMRNWAPYLRDTLREMTAAGKQNAVGFILAPHQSEASWDRYQQNVRDAQHEAGADSPSVDYVEPWYAHPLFIAAVADQTRAALDRLSESQRASAHLIFTAHSIPVAMAANSPYLEQLTDSSRMVAAALERDSWSIAFQSRSGSPREPWLEPDIGDALRGLDNRAAVVIPIGFVCDHVEVLYDLDVEAAALARELGLTMVRAAAVNDHPKFIEMMASVIADRVTGAQ